MVINLCVLVISSLRKHYRLYGLNKTHLFLRVQKTRKFRIKIPANLIFGEDILNVLYMEAFTVSAQWQRERDRGHKKSKSERGWELEQGRGLSPYCHQWGSNFTSSSKLDHFSNALIPEYRWLGIKHVNPGDIMHTVGQQFIAKHEILYLNLKTFGKYYWQKWQFLPPKLVPLYLLVIRSWKQESYPCPSLASALRKVGPAPHLGNTVELVLVGGVLVSQPENLSVVELTPFLFGCWVAWQEKDALSLLTPTSIPSMISWSTWKSWSCRSKAVRSSWHRPTAGYPKGVSVRIQRVRNRPISHCDEQ